MTETKEHPTQRLRFVQREVKTSPFYVPPTATVRILQQEWEIVELDNGIPMGFRFEWRDVPLEVDA